MSSKLNCVKFYGILLLIQLLMLLNIFNLVGSQELRCKSENHKFLCKNHRCIYSSYVCDGEDDCKDNSDEQFCENRACNLTTHFRCRNQVCVVRDWLCDGTDDCKDNSDEENCDNCTSNKFKCKNGNCILKTWKCDGEDDCKDNSDEENCPVIVCNSTSHFQCTNGDCIVKEWKCDGDIDCHDGSDEQKCPDPVCSKDQFKCKDNGRCISKEYVCDDDADCDDSSDERHCATTPIPCPKGHYTCSSSYGGMSECLMESWVCDGDYDCANGADESDCNPNHCKPDQFACDSRTCIPLSSKCDGNVDCHDGSDETRCRSDSDEVTCNPATTFRCRDNSSCILKTKLCDRFKDCQDHSDEIIGFGQCSHNECDDNNGNCSDICIDTLYSYKCMCSHGYALNKDGLTCDDINECHTKANTCEQRCINLKGSFKCACNEGYVLESGTRCKLKNAATGIVGKDIASLVFSDKLDIRRVVLDSGKVGNFMSVVAARLNHATGLALNVRERKVFWTDLREDTINSMSMNHTHGGASRLIPLKSASILHNPYGLAVDWVNDHLYWTDYTAQSISVAYTNGSWPTQVTKTAGLSPGSIVIHPGQKFIFVTAFGQNVSYIRRFDLSGKGGVNIIAEAIRLPTGLTIDYEEKKLFWADSKLHRLASSNFDGSDRRTILSTYDDLRHPHGVALLFDKVYWTDRESRKLQSCNKWSCTNVTAVDARLYSPMELQVDHPLAQPHFESVCAGHTCEFMCLPTLYSDSSYTCACPYGYKTSTEKGCVREARFPTSTKSSSKSTRGPTPSSDTPGLVTSILSSAPMSVNETRLGENEAGSRTGMKIVIGASVIGLIVIVAFIAYNLYKRQVRKRKRYSHFQNPSYRKKLHSNGHSAPFPAGIPRNGSHAELVEVQSYSELESGRERIDSQDSSESAASSSEHVYHPISSVPVDVEDEAESYMNVSDKRNLVS